MTLLLKVDNGCLITGLVGWKVSGDVSSATQHQSKSHVALDRRRLL